MRGPLLRYVGRRTLYGVLMLAIVSVAVFFFTQALPGDVARQVLGQTATQQQVDALRERLGLDRPLITQYLDWVHGLGTLDLGTSLTSGKDVVAQLAPRLVASALLVALTVLTLLPVAFLLGTAAALRPNGIIDRLVSAMVLLIIALPGFIIAILLVALFATNVVRWLPPTSIIDSRQPVWEQLDLFALPVLALVLGSLPYMTESIRTTLREELASEHVAWARLSGVPGSRVLLRYAVPNAIAPTLQVAGTTLIYLVGGIVAVETVFAFPGVGASLAAAVANRDIPVVQAITMLLAVVALVIYLGADVLGILLTPRLRTSLR
ncbi:MAG: ABC transporter permease [Chloroflexota bacterium]